MRSKVEELRAGIDPLTPLFVLVDPMVGEPLSGLGRLDGSANAVQLREQAWERAIVPIELAGTVALPPHQHPYLIALHGADDPLLDLTVDLADEERLAAQADGLGGQGRAAHRIGGWLQSAMRHEELGTLISAMCRVNTDARTSATYLRLADRRVLDLLCHVAGTARITRQFGRLQSWRYLDTLGNLPQLRSDSESTEPLRITHHEWRRLEQGEMLHRTISKYLGEAGAPGRGLPALYEMAERAVSTAREAALRWPHRFIGSADETVWAALLMLQPAIARLQAVTMLLDDQGSEEDPPEPLRYLYPDLRSLAQQADV